MKRNLLLLLLTIGWVTLTHAQSTPIRIMDLYAVPSLVDNTTLATEVLTVGFKVNRADLAEEVYLWIEEGRTRTKEVISVVHRGEEHFLSYQGQEFPIQGYEAMVNLPLTLEQQESLRRITLVVRDYARKDTDPLYFDF